MRNALLVLAASFATSFATSALAQDQSVQVTGVQQTTRLQPQQLAEIAGVYRLDGGGVFRINQVRNRLMAQLGERPATELVAQTENRFISRDQKMTVDYVPQAFGDLIIVHYPADLARADAPMLTLTLAAN
ncbi:hypothetical protein [Massilia sp. DWR3-1-1]|uniref:hypothetical protein n=1 Tax=Massilia sp. DWR3-1-1 TaxID=2804559 RepID=UPI003CF09848